MNLNADYQKLLGPHSACYIGQNTSKEIQEKSSSGGCLTSLLIAIIEDRLAEGIIGVGWDEKKCWLPKLKCLTTKEEIIRAGGSKYLRIPVNDTLGIIERSNDKMLAVVGHPCTISAIRKMQNRFSNVRFLIGFFCGWCMDWRATEYIFNKLKIEKDKIKKIDYRGGEYPGGFRVELNDDSIKQLPKSLYDYLNIAFLSSGCINCHFYTNEEADISFGDFWHKDYMKYGTIIVRTNKGKQLFNLLKSKVKIKKITPQEVVQSHWYNLSHKKIKHKPHLILLTKIFKNKIVSNLISLKLITLLTNLRKKIIS